MFAAKYCSTDIIRVSAENITLCSTLTTEVSSEFPLQMWHGGQGSVQDLLPFA